MTFLNVRLATLEEVHIGGQTPRAEVQFPPFSPRPSFAQSSLNYVLCEYLGASRSESATLVIVQDRWYFGVRAGYSLCREPRDSENLRDLMWYKDTV
jgi:hypothetical protein